MERSKPGLARIESAMLELLKRKPTDEITVTELCEKADVSRSTFYSHFSNINDVYKQLVFRVISQTSATKPQLKCENCKSNTQKVPLCVAIRESDDYKGLVKDQRFVTTFLEICESDFREDSLKLYQDVCEDDEVAHALYRFQIMGCVSSAKITKDSADWDKIKRSIDTFIRGGLNALRNS